MQTQTSLDTQTVRQSPQYVTRIVAWLCDSIVASGVVFVCAMTAVGSHTAPAQAQSSTVEVKGREYVEAVELPAATVHGFQVTEIRAKLGGFVKTIGRVDGEQVDVGSRVKSGDVLAVLDIPEMENDLAEKLAIVAQTKSAVIQADASIAEAEAAVIQGQAELKQVQAQTAEKKSLLKLNESKHRRLSRLARSGSIGQDNLDEAAFDVEMAEARLASVEADIQAAQAHIQAAEAAVRRAMADKQNAEAKVAVAESIVSRLATMKDYTVIRAPYDGIVTKRMVDLGSYVQPAVNNSAAMPVFQLTQVDRVRIVVAVPNNKVGRVEAGQIVIFDSIGGLQGRAFEGTVTRTAGALDRQTRTMRIEVHLNNPATDTVSGDQVELKPGLYGSLTVIRKEWKGSNRLPVVPTTAVGKDANDNYYVTIMSDGKPTRRRVTVAFNDAAQIGISSGLTIGDKVARSFQK